MKTILTAVTVAALATGALAQSDDKEWEFELSPYLMFAALSGDVSPDGRIIEVPVDIGFSDVFSNLDGAFALFGEARTETYGAGAGYLYVSVAAEEEQNMLVTTLASAKMSAWDVWGFYTVPLSETGSRVDLLAGTRIYSVEGGGGIGIADTAFTTLGKGSWVDLIVGARGTGVFAEKWSATGTVDFGFIGSKGSINGVAMLNWRAANLLSVKAGYRILYMNYEDGERPQGFLWKVTAQGPTAALTFHF